jgi:hypothetical protein
MNKHLLDFTRFNYKILQHGMMVLTIHGLFGENDAMIKYGVSGRMNRCMKVCAI